MNAKIAAANRRGNELRSARARLKREAKERGAIVVIKALREHPVPRELEAVHVEKLLHWIPRFRSDKIAQLLAALPCKPAATVGELTYRKRRVLADALEKRQAKTASGRRAEPAISGGRRAQRRGIIEGRVIA